MADWLIGALINLIGSIAINFGTNLLKLGHDQRKLQLKPNPILTFRSWRIGILFFALGNALNFISFAYAAQSLLAALGSVQFISNILFSHTLFHKPLTLKSFAATTFIVAGNTSLVAFGNHQSPVYTPHQLQLNYKNPLFLLYCFGLSFVILVLMNFSSDQKGDTLPFSYAVVSGAVGSSSVIFAKSLSNLMRLYSLSGSDRPDGWFVGWILLLFLCSGGFWMARLNQGLERFDAVVIVPMFQITWTFFSICTGFVYFQEYQVFDALRTIMFVLGMLFLFVGVSLLAPDDQDIPLLSSEKLVKTHEASLVDGVRSLAHAIKTNVFELFIDAKVVRSASKIYALEMA